MTASWCRSVAGPGEVRVDIRAIAQGWRRSAWRADCARSRIAVFQSAPPAGRSISPKTRSTMPSRSSSLLATWLYSDIASTPTASPSLRMLSDAIPFSSAKATAAARTRSLLRGVRGFVADLDVDAISLPPGLRLTTLRRKYTITYNVSQRPSE